MERLIDANALKDKISNIKLRVKSPEMMAGLVEMKAAALREIENAQTVEAEPVRHGRWIPVDGEPYAKCSYCGEKHYGCTTPYCDMCGAYMRKDGDDHIADANKKVGGDDNG